jgi:hypothetical protein
LAVIERTPWQRRARVNAAAPAGSSSAAGYAHDAAQDRGALRGVDVEARRSEQHQPLDAFRDVRPRSQRDRAAQAVPARLARSRPNSSMRAERARTSRAKLQSGGWSEEPEARQVQRHDVVRARAPAAPRSRSRSRTTSRAAAAEAALTPART